MTVIFYNIHENINIYRKYFCNSFKLILRQWTHDENIET